MNQDKLVRCDSLQRGGLTHNPFFPRGIIRNPLPRGIPAAAPLWHADASDPLYHWLPSSELAWNLPTYDQKSWH